MRASSPAVETPGLEYEAVSPELVLVDPELARRARRALSMPRPVPSSTVSRSRRLLVVPPAILGSALALTTVVLPVWAVHRSEGTVKVNPTPAPVEQPLRFSWAAVPGAHSYRLVVYRGGTRIYEAVATKPEQMVPVHWKLGERRFRLTRGTYRWVVIPRRGAAPPFREGKPIVDSSYTA